MHLYTARISRSFVSFLIVTTTRSVIEKLLAAEAVQMGGNKEPSFTKQFLNYVSIYTRRDKEGLQYVQGWRAMLAGFHIPLVHLADEELSTIVRLVEYQQEVSAPSQRLA